MRTYTSSNYFKVMPIYTQKLGSFSGTFIVLESPWDLIFGSNPLFLDENDLFSEVSLTPFVLR